MLIQSVQKVKGVEKHGGAIYKDLFCTSIEESSNKDKNCECLRTIWKFWHTTVPPRAIIEMHSHDYHEQIYFVLKGSGIITVGNESKRVKEGDAIYIPPNALHGFRNDSNAPCEMICVGANLFRSTLGIKE
jgi:mannose-6-phosphate isomerase-like protein (cupin superfamily)